MGIDDSRLAEVKRTFWQRHANPWSGWTRVVTYPLLMLGIYRRDGRLLAGTTLFVLLNPVLFPAVDSDEAWMSRVVLGERLWLSEGRKASLVNLLNVANVPVSLYAVYSAYRRRPLRTAVATAGSMLLKFLFVNEMVKFYDTHTDAGELLAEESGDDATDAAATVD
jgi:hypothetical protein